MAKSDYTNVNFIITGHGRSGSNLLIDILDCHPNTFCRNEPDITINSAFSRLGDLFFPTEEESFKLDWIKTIKESKILMGDKDRKNYNHKEYYNRKISASANLYIYKRRRLRSALGIKHEWPINKHTFDMKKFADSIPVFKILLASGGISKTHFYDERQFVLHILREPKGFLKSWFNRYVGENRNEVFKANLINFKKILDYFDRQDEYTEEYSLENLIKSELWRWRYVNELLLNEIGKSERYLTVLYSDITNLNMDTLKTIFEHLNLELTDETVSRILKIENTLFSSGHTRTMKIENIDEIIENVLFGSKLNNLLNTE